ncbi:MAG: rod shape-determining protein MreC [Candidatus Latescibacterota bacterium]
MKWILDLLNLRRSSVVLSIAIILSLIMMGLREPGKAHLAKTVSITLLRGGQWLFSWPIYLSGLSEENRFLRKRNLELSLQVQKQRETDLENLRLRNLLGFKTSETYSYLPAEVVAKDADRMINAILINVGAQDGVREKMPVATAEGLVGKVFEVFPSTSIVQLLLDRNCRISGVAQNDGRVFGIVEWFAGERYKMAVPLRSAVGEGDRIVSSGMGGVFPKGLEIGVVEKIGSEEGGPLRDLIVKSSVRFSQLEEVFVLFYKGYESNNPQ